MMLKINKTLPINKARCNSYTKVNNDATYSSYCNTITKRISYLGLATLICGIMPGLMGLGYYSNSSSFGFSSNKAYAVEVKTLSDITTMQELTQSICGNTEIGTSKVLIDTRDDSDYQVTKLSDGNCWMGQNLRLAGGTVLNRMDTDLDPSVYTSDSQTYTLPTASNSFSNTKTTDSTGAETYMNHQVYNSTNNDYGAYYSWCAATAGTCQVGSYADIQPKQDEANGVYYTAAPANTAFVGRFSQASSSICPKGWRLPTSAEYTTLENNGTVKTGDFSSDSKNSGYWIGNDVENNTGGMFFSAAGAVGTAGIKLNGFHGFYWSSTAISDRSAYGLSFLEDSVPGINGNGRYGGRSLRCLVNGNVAKDTNVSVVVSPTLTLDVVTGAESIEADPSKIAIGNITATVSSNTNYKLQLSSNKPDLTDPNHPETEGIKASSNVVKGTNAWGIKNEEDIYSAVTTTPTPFYNTTTTNDDLSTTHTFTLGVSISNTLPSGEYSTTVTITAVNN